MRRCVRLIVSFLFLGLLSACGNSVQLTESPNASEAIVETVCEEPAKSVSVSSWQEQYDLGIRFLSEGNYEEAIIAFTAAIEIDPRRAEAYVGRGDAYIRNGDGNLIAALEDYMEAARIDGRDPAFWLYLGELYTLLDDPETELRDLLEEWSWKDGQQALIDKVAELKLEPTHVSKEYSADGSLTKETYASADGTIVFVAEYDQTGKRIKATSYKKSGELQGYDLYEYDEFGNLTKVLIFNAERKLESYNSYEYDSEGRKTVESHYDGDDTLRFRFWYDEDGRLIRMRTLDAPQKGSIMESIAELTSSRLIQGELEQVVTVEHAELSGQQVATAFDSDKRMVYQIRYSDGTVDSYTIPEYDQEGRLITETDYTAEGVVSLTAFLEYDEHGRRNRWTAFDSDGNLDFYEVYQYREDGVSQQIGYTADDVLWYVMEHHPDGSIDHLTWYNEDGSLLYTDEYGADGYVVNRIVY